MTQEEKFVVNPLEEYFLDPKRSGALWNTKSKPNFGSSATGWDLQMERKNQVLLIEAKYIRGSAASAFSGLVFAPFSSKRPEKMKSKKEKSWSAVISWAIGCGYDRGNRDKIYKMSGMYQILFDLLIKNLSFWDFYSKTLKVKYIYFVDDNKVGKISFNKIISLAGRYKSTMSKTLHERRLLAERLLVSVKFK